MDLSIIIVNWNTCELLAQCLASLYAHKPLCQFEVWVVDNASSDGSLSMMSSKYPEVHVIQNQSNVGFARANNLAIRASTGDYVLLLNSDVVVLPEAINRLYEVMRGQPDVGIAGSKLLWPDGTFQSSFNDFPTLLSIFLTLSGVAKRVYGKYHPSHGPQEAEESRYVDWVGGACMIANRKAILEVGLFDEDFFMYGEEMDWCLRMRLSKWKIQYIPNASVIHLGGQSSASPGFNRVYWLTKSHILFVRKYYGARSAACVNIFARICFFLRAILLGFTGAISLRGTRTQPKVRQYMTLAMSDFRR